MKTAIIIAITMLTIGFIGMVGTTYHVAPASIFSSSLQQNLNYSFSGYNSFSGEVFHVNTQMYKMNGTFNYANYPIVISSWTFNGGSSAFSAVIKVSGWTSDYVAISVSVVFNVLLQNESTGQWQVIYPDYAHPTFQTGGGYSEYSFQGQLTSGIIRINNPNEGIIEVQANETINTTAETFIGSYNKTADLFTQAYLVPGGGTINTSPSVQQVGGNVYIHGQVNFGKYYVLLYGSPGYNGGALVKNYTINGQNTFYNFTFVVPQGAFTNSSNPQENEWTVELWNQLIAQHTDQFFTVDKLSLMPPTPTIKITNTPSNDKWVIGSTVDVMVKAPSNPNSSNQVDEEIVWVYYNVGGEPAPGSSYWIIDNQNYPVSGGYGNFTFQLGNSIQSVTIKVVAVDSAGRVSYPAIVTIQASQITTGNTTRNQSGSMVAIIIVAMSIAIGGIIDFLMLPMNLVDKSIIFIGIVGMMAMLYFPIANYFTVTQTLPASITSLIIFWIMSKGVI